MAPPVRAADKAQPGSDISFVIELEAPQGRLKVTCRGTVVRAEKLESRTGIAVQLADMNMATEG